MTGITEKPRRLGSYGTCPNYDTDLPSPAASGCSEMDSEPDAHDSGRVSEVESSPKLTHCSRVTCQTLIMSTGAPNCKRSRGTQGGVSASPQSKSGRDGSVAIDVGVLKALLICVRENRSRLAEAEVRLRNTENAMMTMHRDFQSQLTQLTKELEKRRSCSAPRHSSSSTRVSTSESPVDDKEPRDWATSPLGLFADPCTQPDDDDTCCCNESDNDKHVTDVAGNGHPLYAVVRKPPKPACSSSRHGIECSSSDHDALSNQSASDADDDGKGDTLKATIAAAAEQDPYSRISSGDDEDCAEFQAEIARALYSVPKNASAHIRECEVSRKSHHETFAPFPPGPTEDHSLEAERCQVTSNNPQLNFSPNCFSRQRWWQVEEAGTAVAQAESPQKNGRVSLGSRAGSSSSVASKKFPSMENLKPGTIVHKLKRKFKGRRPKVSRDESTDSAGVRSVSEDSESNWCVVDGDLTANNNNAVLPCDKLKANKSILAYRTHAAAPPPRSSFDDSAGNESDADSMRSARVSETFAGNRRSDADQRYARITDRQPAALPVATQCAHDTATNSNCGYSAVGFAPRAPARIPPTTAPAQRLVAESVGRGMSGRNTLALEDCEASDDVFDRKGEILSDVERQQEERRRLESGISSSRHPDEPPPKPSRPGFPGPPARGAYPPQGGAPAYQPTAQPGMYAPSRPVVPPKSAPKIMTSEEIKRHEAEEKLRLKQLQEASIEEKLAHQKLQAAEDDRWLQQEEIMLNPEQTDPNGDEAFDPDHVYQSADEIRRQRAAGGSRSGSEAPPPPNVPPAKPPRNPLVKEPPQPPMPKLNLEEVKPTPTMKVDRSNDAVYRDTMNVVKAVLQTNQETMNGKPDDLFTLVKGIGVALKQLCNSLDEELKALPEQFHREIDMAQKTTNKDLSQIINQLKLVKRFFETSQVVEYKKCMMAATQVLAIDAKNLLDVVDKARISTKAGETSGQSSDSGERSGVEEDLALPPPPSEFLEQG